MERFEKILRRISIGEHRTISIILILIAILTINPQAHGFNDSSRMATIQSLVENHTLSIDQSDFFDGYDKVFINGRYYSDKPVFTALFGAAVYYPLFLLGIELGNGWNLAYYLITLFTVKLFWYMGLKVFYDVLRFTEIEKKDRLYITLALGIGTLFFTWSSTFNNHVLSASLLIFGLYFLLDLNQSVKPIWKSFLAGLCFSLAGVQDHTMLVFYGIFGLYLLFQRRSFVIILGYSFPLVFTVLPTLVINYAASGNVIPFYLVKEYYLYPDYPSLEGNLFTGMQLKVGWDLVDYSFTSLVGKKGFLIHNPLTFIALPLMYEEIRKKGRFWREAIVLGFSSLVVIIIYLLTSDDYSGFAYSIRWFVPLLPLWFIFLYRVFLPDRPKLQKWFSRLLLISVVVASVGLIDPWTKIVTGVPFIDNLIILMLGV